MSNRLNDAMAKLNVDPSRNSLGRPPPSPGAKRNSGLDSSTINAMFPDAAAAIAKKKAEFTQQTGNAPPSNRNSAVFGERTSLVTPTISAPDNNDNLNQWPQRSAAETQPPIARPKSSSGHQPMGQFSQPPAVPSSLRSPLPQTGPGQTPEIDAPLLSPYNLGNASWASMTNTPMTASFGNQQSSGTSQADMVANATAMKLAALSTVNNRFALDDARKYRRARSNDGQGRTPITHGNTNFGGAGFASPGIPGASLAPGQFLTAQQLAALQAQQQAALLSGRSRPTSPGIAALQAGGGVGGSSGGGLSAMGFMSPQNNGFLAAYDPNNPLLGNGLSAMGIGPFGLGGPEGYLSDHSEVARGRSPRGRRGSSKPPEDPTDPTLLRDIPSWLRSLRLHKYTDQLKDLKWDELIDLDDAALEERGVNALGARNKMLKVC